MPWHEQHHYTPIDEQPINGLSYLHGNLMAHQYRQEWVRGQKYPNIAFPSGISRELIQTSETANICVFDDVRLPYPVKRDEAYQLLTSKENTDNYQIIDLGSRGFTIHSRLTRRGFRFSFDSSSGELLDLTNIPPDAMELLPLEIRAALPHLYANEHLGGKAIGVVKFFTPDAHWTWYASEGSPVDEDGYYDTDKPKVDYIFFGLVDGDELESGYFSLTELEAARGILGLPVERDLYYIPETMDALREKHHTLRGF